MAPNESKCIAFKFFEWYMCKWESHYVVQLCPSKLQAYSQGEMSTLTSFVCISAFSLSLEASNRISYREKICIIIHNPSYSLKLFKINSYSGMNWRIQIAAYTIQCTED